MKRVELVDMSGSSLKKQIEKKCNLSHNDGAILRFQIQFAKHRLFAECHRAILRFFVVFLTHYSFLCFRYPKSGYLPFTVAAKKAKKKAQSQAQANPPSASSHPVARYLRCLWESGIRFWLFTGECVSTAILIIKPTTNPNLKTAKYRSSLLTMLACRVLQLPRKTIDLTALTRITALSTDKIYSKKCTLHEHQLEKHQHLIHTNKKSVHCADGSLSFIFYKTNQILFFFFVIFFLIYWCAMLFDSINTFHIPYL